MIPLCTLAGALAAWENHLNGAVFAFCLTLAIPIINLMRKRRPPFIILKALLAGGVAGFIASRMTTNASIPAYIIAGAAALLVYNSRQVLRTSFIETTAILCLVLSVINTAAHAGLLSVTGSIPLVVMACVGSAFLFTVLWLPIVFLFDPCYGLDLNPRGNKYSKRLALAVMLAALPGMFLIHPFLNKMEELKFRSLNQDRSVIAELQPGSSLYAGGRVYRFPDGKIRPENFPVQPFRSYSISGSLLAVKSNMKGDISIYTVPKTAKPLRAIRNDGCLFIISPDSRLLAVTHGRRLCVYSIDTGLQCATAVINAEAHNLCWLSGNSGLVIQTRSNEMFKINLADGKIVPYASGGEPLLLPDGNIAYHRNSAIKVNNPEGTRERLLCRLPFISHEMLFDFCLSPDLRHIAYRLPVSNNAFPEKLLLVIANVNDGRAMVIDSIPAHRWDVDMYWTAD